MTMIVASYIESLCIITMFIGQRKPCSLTHPFMVASISDGSISLGEGEEEKEMRERMNYFWSILDPSFYYWIL